MLNGKLRHRLKITLRAMMLLILILSVWLGWQVNRAREQREAVAAVQRYGGWVHYDFEFVNNKLTSGRSPWAPRWLRRMLGDEFFQEVRQVSLVYDDSTGKRYDNANVVACDDVLARVARLPGLRSLLLKESQATDEGMRHIGKMAGLEELLIWDAESVTDGGVAHLAGLKGLKNIHISHSNLTDVSLALLSRLPAIETLSLQQNHFSDEGLARLTGKERLKGLYIGIGDLRVTDAGLAHLGDFKKLEGVDVQDSQVTARGLEQLVKDLPNLKQLWLSDKVVTEAEREALRQARPGLKILY
jgi:hypothetical protein